MCFCVKRKSLNISWQKCKRRWLDTGANHFTKKKKKKHAEDRITERGVHLSSQRPVYRKSKIILHALIHHHHSKMKILTLNFLTCAVKACKQTSTSTLHPKDVELASSEIELNPKLLINILPRLDWKALQTTAAEVNDSPNQNYSRLTHIHS